MINSDLPINVVYGVIDAENINPNFINDILNDLTNKIKYDSKFKNCYLKIIAIADWSNASNPEWKTVSLKYNMECLQQFNYSKGANLSDILIASKTIELINQAPNKNELIKGIVIISNDVDFIPLIQEIRKKHIFCMAYLQENLYKNELEIAYDQHIKYPSELLNDEKNITEENLPLTEESPQEPQPSAPLTKKNNQLYLKPSLTSPVFNLFFRTLNIFLIDNLNKGYGRVFTTTRLWSVVSGHLLSKDKKKREEIKKNILSEIKSLNLTPSNKTYTLVNAFLIAHNANFTKVGQGNHPDCFTYKCEFLFGFKNI